MIGFLRNAAVIGAIAYFSPVHDASPEARLEALRAAPGLMMSEALKAAPAIALHGVGNMDAASRDALAAKITAIAAQSGEASKATNRR